MIITSFRSACSEPLWASSSNWCCIPFLDVPGNLWQHRQLFCNFACCHLRLGSLRENSDKAKRIDPESLESQRQDLARLVPHAACVIHDSPCHHSCLLYCLSCGPLPFTLRKCMGPPHKWSLRIMDHGDAGDTGRLRALAALLSLMFVTTCNRTQVRQTWSLRLFKHADSANRIEALHQHTGCQVSCPSLFWQWLSGTHPKSPALSPH